MKFAPLAVVAALSLLPSLARAADAPASSPEDPYLWLEETDSTKALDWVKARNEDTVKKYASSPEFKKRESEILEILDSDARIPYVGKMGDHWYNFWKDKDH